MEPLCHLWRLPFHFRRLRGDPARRRLRDAFQPAQHRAADSACDGDGRWSDFRADGGRDRSVDRLDRRGGGAARRRRDARHGVADRSRCGPRRRRRDRRPQRRVGRLRAAAVLPGDARDDGRVRRHFSPAHGFEINPDRERRLQWRVRFRLAVWRPVACLVDAWGDGVRLLRPRAIKIRRARVGDRRQRTRSARRASRFRACAFW